MTRRTENALAFYGRDLHGIVFRPHADHGNYSGYGFHLRIRRNGVWRHLLAKTNCRVRGNPNGRQHEVVTWRSRHATSGRGKRKGDRIGRKAYVRLKTSRARADRSNLSLPVVGASGDGELATTPKSNSPRDTED